MEKVVEVFQQVEMRFKGVPNWPSLDGRVDAYA